jgi:hypothetical protein
MGYGSGTVFARSATVLERVAFGDNDGRFVLSLKLIRDSRELVSLKGTEHHEGDLV